MRKCPVDTIQLIHAYNGDNWSEVARSIREKYNHLQKNSDVLRSQINNLKQGEKESLYDYSERARKLVLQRSRMKRKWKSQEWPQNHSRRA